MAGCLEVEQHFMLNPDGSGKVKIESSITDRTPDARDPGLGKRIRRMALASIDSTKGVDAWRDVSYSYNNGRFHFRGTAYFSDIARLQGGSLGMLRFRTTRNSIGSLVVHLLVGAKPGYVSTGSQNPSSLSIDEQIDSLRKSLSVARNMMGAFLSRFRIRTEFSIPESIPESVPDKPRGVSENHSICALTPNRRGNRELELTGSAILDALDSLMGDRDLLLRQLDQPADSSQAVMQTLLLPGCGLPSFNIPRSGRASFDYPKEVAAARREHRKIMRTLRK